MKGAVVGPLSDELGPHETCDRSGLLVLTDLLCVVVCCCLTVVKVVMEKNGGKMSLRHSSWYVTVEAHSISTLLCHLQLVKGCQACCHGDVKKALEAERGGAHLVERLLRVLL